MVSVRRRKLKNFLTPGKQADNFRLARSSTNGNCFREIVVENPHAETPNSMSKKQKQYPQIDPYNSMEVHTYLMSLKEKSSFDLASIPPEEGLPLYQLMEVYFPHIFKVFPQNFQPVISPENSRTRDVLYPLFLLAVKTLVSMDHETPPDLVKALCLVINNLEMEGFDCRFIRSEMLVKGYLIRQQLDIAVARKNLIAERIANIEKGIVAGQEEHAAVEMEEECLDSILKLHKKLLADVEAESERILLVLENLCILLPGQNVGLHIV